MVKATQKVVEETVKVTLLGSSRRKQPSREKITKDIAVTTTTVVEEKGRKNKIISDKDVTEPEPEELEEEESQRDQEKEEEVTGTADDEEEEEPKKDDLPSSVTVEEPPKKEEEKKKKKKTRRGGGEAVAGYKRYVFTVLKQVHPGVGISSKAMKVVNGFINDMFERIANEAAKLCRYSGRMTMSAREIQGAVKLVLPGELGKHAMAEGTKAVSTFLDYPNSNYQ